MPKLTYYVDVMRPVATHPATPTFCTMRTWYATYEEARKAEALVAAPANVVVGSDAHGVDSTQGADWIDALQGIANRGGGAFVNDYCACGRPVQRDAADKNPICFDCTEGARARDAAINNAYLRAESVRAAETKGHAIAVETALRGVVACISIRDFEHMEKPLRGAVNRARTCLGLLPL
jgi:hypothetical protein